MSRYLPIAALMFAVACGGDDDPAPVATVVEFTPESLDPDDDLADDLTILVEYRDADGDLGDGTAEVHDCRADDLIAVFDLPPIASQEAIDEGVPIEGQLSIVVADVGDVEASSRPPVVCEDLGIDSVADGEAVFCVVLIDAAGNEGPGDCTGAVTIASP